jgi:SAM-dependent methyltransferase
MSDHTTVATTGLLTWIADRPDITSRLRREPPDRVLVLACGQGTDVVALASTFPNITVYGVDSDAAAVQAVQAAAAASPARDRVLILQRDEAEPRLGAPFELLVAVGLTTDPSRSDPPGATAALWLVSRLVAVGGLAIVDSTVPLQGDAVTEAGFRVAEPLGSSRFGYPAYVLRR